MEIIHIDHHLYFTIHLFMTIIPNNDQYCQKWMVNIIPSRGKFLALGFIYHIPLVPPVWDLKFCLWLKASFLPFSAHSSGNIITTTGMTLGRLGTSIVGNVVRPSRKSNMAISPKRCKSWRRQELSRATQLSRLRSQGFSLDPGPKVNPVQGSSEKNIFDIVDVLMMYYDIYIYFFGGWFGTWLVWLSISWEWKIIPTDELHHFSEG